MFVASKLSKDKIITEMSKTINISPALIEKLGDLLPRGCKAEISEETGYSQQYISQFFKSKISVTNENYVIIERAEVKIKLSENEKTRKEKKLNKLLSDHKA